MQLLQFAAELRAQRGRAQEQRAPVSSTLGSLKRMVDLIETNHTGRELELMLAGRKPLAMFYAELSELPNEELIPEQHFANSITQALLIREEFAIDGPFSQALGRLRMRCRPCKACCSTLLTCTGTMSDAPAASNSAWASAASVLLRLT